MSGLDRPKRRKARFFTPEEDTIILNMRGRYQLWRIAEVVGRSPDSVRDRFMHLGLERRNIRGPTPKSVGKELGMHEQQAHRIANRLFGELPRGKYLTQEQVDEMIRFILENGYKCKYHPHKKKRGDGETVPSEAQKLRRPSWDTDRKSTESETG